ncbi:MAG: hypothetical protein JW776_05665 [Candidatus Lokiarchaeota archaeon]|nr:hypothetical protein [Candidatus Lokiarchaeota archaeon]
MYKRILGIIGFSGVTMGICFEIFSILIYELKLFSDFWSFCSSPCTIWPGIPTSRVCILVCEYRSYLYLPFFIFGIFLLISACAIFFVRRRK